MELLLSSSIIVEARAVHERITKKGILLFKVNLYCGGLAVLRPHAFSYESHACSSLLSPESYPRLHRSHREPKGLI